MFNEHSRYHHLETCEMIDPEGRVIRYKRRRFLPDAEKMTPLGEVIVAAGDRLDIITARVLGDAQVFDGFGLNKQFIEWDHTSIK